MPTADDQNAILQATHRVLQAATTRGAATFLMASSALLALTGVALEALAPGVVLPAALATVAGGLGVEALGALLQRLADGEQISNETILAKLDAAIAASEIQQLLARDQQLVDQLMQLQSWQQHLLFVTRRGDSAISQLLIDQFEARSAQLAGLQTDIAAIRATSQAQADQLTQILALLQANPTRPQPAPQTSAGRPANPFGYRGQITELSRYLVRQPLTTELFEDLGKGQSLSLVGPAQSGKSSLLWYVKEQGPARLGKAPADFVYINMELIHSEEDFFDWLCAQLDLPQMRGFRLFQQLRGRQLIVCLDEMEKMAWSGFTPAMHSEIRGLIDGDGPLTVVAASRVPLAQLLPDRPGQTSPLANLFLTLTLPAFNPQEATALCRQLLDGSGVGLSAELIQRAWQLSQGQPYQLQLELKKLYDLLG